VHFPTVNGVISYLNRAFPNCQRCIPLMSMLHSPIRATGLAVGGRYVSVDGRPHLATRLIRVHGLAIRRRGGRHLGKRRAATERVGGGL